MSVVTPQPVEMVALNADVVGYSRLMADDFAATTATMDDYHRLVAERVAAGGGTVANFVGDSFMAVFADAKDALGTAIGITRDVEARTTGIPEGRQARFRMGLDQGPVVVSGDDYHGDALNTSARIQALAPQGGISVSGRVYQALDEPALRFRPMGRQRLKNLPEPVEIYEFADLPTDRTAVAQGRSLSLESPTLAVVPIHIEASSDEVRAAARVIRHDLVHRLAAVPELTVVDAAAAGTHGETTARYMVETGVLEAGGAVRVYATLFDVTTWNVVKAHKWTVPAAELLALSDELADEVARTVEVELVVGEPAGLYAELDDPEAIENVYLGWYHLRSDTREGWAHALELFGRVARSHPDQPYGHVLSAFAYWVGASNEWAPDPDAALRKARELARVGLDIGDPTGMAKAVEAAVLMSRGDADAALAAMDELEIIRPTCDVTFGLEGSIRRYLGQWEQAVDLLDVAMRLTGVNKPWYPTVKACSLFHGGRIEQAASIAEAVLDHQPHNLEALLVLAAAQVELGLDRRAHATADLIKEQFPSVDVAEWIDRNPYQSRDVVARWKRDLAAAGAIAAE
jgi:class 3 adenylate cyclase/TolB-like protein